MLIGELTDIFLAWCGRHRAPATCEFYRARLRQFCQKYNGRDLASLTPLEVDEHLAEAGEGTSDSTRHHNAQALERLQKFALDNNLLDRPAFGKLEKPRVGQLDRLPTSEETEAILSRSSPAFRLIYSALRQCGARPVELCRIPNNASRNCRGGNLPGPWLFRISQQKLKCATCKAVAAARISGSVCI